MIAKNASLLLHVEFAWWWPHCLDRHLNNEKDFQSNSKREIHFFQWKSCSLWILNTKIMSCIQHWILTRKINDFTQLKKSWRYKKEYCDDSWLEKECKIMLSHLKFFWFIYNKMNGFHKHLLIFYFWITPQKIIYTFAQI